MDSTKAGWLARVVASLWVAMSSSVLLAQAQVPSSLLAVTPRVAASSYTSMALDESGNLWGWGDNSNGLLGRPAKSYLPVKVKRERPYLRAVSGFNRQYLQDSDGVFWGSGANFFGQLGDGTNFLRRTGLVRVLGSYLELAPGGLHTLGVDASGSLWVWGNNASGQLGDGGVSTARRRPHKLTLPHAVVSMAAGGEHSLVVLQDGTLWAWGGNASGQLGDGSTTTRMVPVQIGSGFVQVAAGRSFSVARKSDGSVWAWGANSRGQLGDGTTTQRNEPVKIAGTWAQVGAGAFSAWLLDSRGDLYLQGLSYAAPNDALTQATLLMSDVSQVSAGDLHLLALKKDQTLVALGDNSLGQLGIDDNTVGLVRTPRTVALAVRSFSASASASVAVTSDGRGYAWGDNGEGQLGLGRDQVLSTPVLVAENVSDFSLSGSSAFAVARNGDLYAWGENSDGRLGDGTQRDRANPFKIGSGFARVISANLQTFALKSDGSLWGWGANDFGQLGLGDTTARPTPVKVGDGYTTVAAGAYHTVALKTDGSLWAWGRNQHGQLGNGQFEQRTGAQANATPVRIGEGFTDVMAGTHHSVALKADGTLWAWGWNDYGQVGDGSTTSRATPVQVLSSVSKLLSAQISTVVQTRDGKTHGWGYNGESRRRYNMLLLGPTRFNITSPTVIPGDWAAASIGSGHGLYLRRDGLVASVGYQQFGQLGDGSFDDVRQSFGLVLAGETTGFLDLLPTLANVPIGVEGSRVFLRSYLQGTLSSLSLGLEVRLPPYSASVQGTIRSVAAGRGGVTYSMYVVAALPSSAGTVLFDLKPQVEYPDPTWGPLGFPIAAYLSNLAADAESTVIVDVLTNSDLSMLPGATLYLGYGTSSDEMLAAGRYKAFFTVPMEP